MMPDEPKVIELKEAAIRKYDVVAVAKGIQPATVHTLDTPYIHIVLREAQPLIISYMTEEERDAEYNLILTAMKDRL